MKLAPDTDVLIRAFLSDDPAQGSITAKILIAAESIAVAPPCRCEFVCVLLRLYHFQPSKAAAAIRAMLAAADVQMNRPAAEAGLSVIEAGGRASYEILASF